MQRCEQVKVDEKDPDPEHRRYVPGGKGLQEAGEDLCRFIDEHRLTDSTKGPRRPLVVLAFDEADTLTDNPPDQDTWNLFSELRRVLRQIQHNPISEISFDDIACSALKDTVTIDKLVGIQWISHLGRPLYVHPGHPF